MYGGGGNFSNKQTSATVLDESILKMESSQKYGNFKEFLRPLLS